MSESGSPVFDRLATVARELGELAADVVFIGGAIAPLLQTDPPFPRARVTSDVDGVIASHGYRVLDDLMTKLRTQGFQQDVQPKHIHRWISPSGIPFDLVPAGEHTGGSGNPWDAAALETAVTTTLPDGTAIRHAAAPAFLAQKWAAHHDRGRNDPLDSHDLEDVLALVASRPELSEEVQRAPKTLRGFLAGQARTFLNDAYASDLLGAHLNNAQDPSRTVRGVRARLEGMAAAGEATGTGVETMQRRLEQWVPDGSRVHGPTLARGSTFVRWRIDFPSGVTARVSFRTSDVEDAQTALWDTIRSHSLLQGGSGNFRVEAGQVLGNPPEWEGW